MVQEKRPLTTRDDEMDEMEDITTAEGLGDAMIGVGRRCGQPTLAVYDVSKVLEILMATGFTDEEAIEFFEYNIEGSWVGETTPIWFYPSADH